jgi:hypothetical protein
MQTSHGPPGVTIRGLYDADDWGSESPQWSEPPPSPKEPGPFTRLMTRAVLNSGALQNTIPSVQGIINSAINGLMLIDITTIY